VLTYARVRCHSRVLSLIRVEPVLRFVTTVLVKRYLRIDGRHFQPWSVIYMFFEVVVQVLTITLSGLYHRDLSWHSCIRVPDAIQRRMFSRGSLFVPTMEAIPRLSPCLNYYFWRYSADCFFDSP
jgi:hypothetical protein